MKYAPIVGYDEEKGQWVVIGVFGVNVHGAALLRVDKRCPLVVATPAFRSMEEVYNLELEDGEVSFYAVPKANESSSPVVHIKTTDQDFIEQYASYLNSQKKLVRLGEVKQVRGENISTMIDSLLSEVVRNGNK